MLTTSNVPISKHQNVNNIWAKAGKQGTNMVDLANVRDFKLYIQGRFKYVNTEWILR